MIDYGFSLDEIQKNIDSNIKRTNDSIYKSIKNINKNILKSTERNIFNNLEKTIKSKRLTSSQAKKLKEFVGFKCEYCKKKHPKNKSHYLHHHHIKGIKENPQMRMDNVIILDLYHHADADRNLISRGKLREIVRKRNKILAKKISSDAYKRLATHLKGKKKGKPSSVFDIGYNLPKISLDYGNIDRLLKR